MGVTWFTKEQVGYADSQEVLDCVRSTASAESLLEVKLGHAVLTVLSGLPVDANDTQ